MAAGSTARLACLALFAALAGERVGASPGSDAPAGILVESVAKGSAADKAGVRPGDRIASWSRVASPQANPEPAGGILLSPLQLGDVELEQAPRGAVTLLGARGPNEMRWTFPPTPFGITAIPLLPDRFLADYRAAKELVETRQ